MRRSVAGRKVGELEGQVLDQLWAAEGWLSCREVLERLGDKNRAYTTVLTVLSRLVAKGLVERRQEGRGHCYRAVGDADELTAQAIGALLAGASDRRAALAHFVEGIEDPDLVEELVLVLERVRRS